MERASVEAWIIGHGDRHAARRATRAILGYTLGVPGSEVTISRRCAHCGDPEHGKPFVDGVGDVSFSMSYSAPLALVAVARGIEVGADIEVVRPRRYLDRLARRLLAPDDHAQWEALPDGRRLEAFLQAWTAKEAYLKAIGRGITVPFHDVPMRPDGWTIVMLPVSGGVAHVAAEGAVEIRTRTWHAPRVSASGGTAS